MPMLIITRGLQEKPSRTSLPDYDPEVRNAHAVPHQHHS